VSAQEPPPQSPGAVEADVFGTLGASDEVRLPLPGPVLDALAGRIASAVIEQLEQRLAPPATPWLDIDSACAYLGFSRDKLYKLTAARAIPCRKKIDGQGLYFRREELDAWMEVVYPRVDPGG
jgi:excisionase family DNA binding protein